MSSIQSLLHTRKLRRAARTRASIVTPSASVRPRLSVHRSLRHIYAQVIDDANGITLASASDHNLEENLTKTEAARKVGQAIAEAAKKNNVTLVRFDRGAAQYQGRVAALAEAARENGLQF